MSDSQSDGGGGGGEEGNSGGNNGGSGNNYGGGSSNSNDYSYDDKGINFSFFLSALLTLVLVPYTYRFFFSRKLPFAKASKCQCSKCHEKYKFNRAQEASNERKPRMIKFVFLCVAWALYASQLHKAITAVIIVPQQFDPWKILGIDKDAPANIIRKSYYKLSLVFHPDKVRTNNKTEAHEFFLTISRAYYILSDSTALQNFMDFGNPDGQRPMTTGIALPDWMINSKNSPFVLSGYILIFGILIPLSINSWWRRNRRMTKEKILYETMTLFFRRLTDNDKIDDILSLVCHAQEFVEDFQVPGEYINEARFACVEKAIVKIVNTAMTVPDPDEKALNDHYAPSSPVSRKVWAILLAHMLRLSPPASERLTKRVIVRAVHLLQRGVFPIFLTRSWFMQTMFTIDLTQLLVQGCFLNSSPLLQIPHMTEAILSGLSISAESRRSIEDFVRNNSEKERERKLSGVLTKSQLKDIDIFFDAYPKLIVESFKCKVAGEENVTPGSVVSCTVTLRAVSAKSTLNTFAFADRKNEKESGPTDIEDSFELEGEGDGVSGKKIKVAQRMPAGHAPFFPGEKPPVWHVMLLFSETNRIMAHQTISDIGDKPTPVLLRFEAPEKTGQFTFYLMIQSDHFTGSDFKINVSQEVTQKQERPVIEDEISDPDEDTIAGQMALLRGQKVSRRDAKPRSSKSSKNGGSKSSGKGGSTGTASGAITGAATTAAVAAAAGGPRRRPLNKSGSEKSNNSKKSGSASSSGESAQAKSSQKGAASPSGRRQNRKDSENEEENSSEAEQSGSDSGSVSDSDSGSDADYDDYDEGSASCDD